MTRERLTLPRDREAKFADYHELINLGVHHENAARRVGLDADMVRRFVQAEARKVSRAQGAAGAKNVAISGKIEPVTKSVPAGASTPQIRDLTNRTPDKTRSSNG